MEYTNADVFAYQILDCLVTKYQYQIVNVPGNKKDIWLACEKNETFPMIRLSANPSTSIIFEKDYLMSVKGALAAVLKSDKPLLVMNTNEESKGFVADEVIQVILTGNQINNNDVSNVFPELKAVVKVVDNKQEECARLTRHMEVVQLRKLKEARKFSIKKVPIVTGIILVVCAIITLVASAFIFTEGSDLASALVVSGAYYKSLVLYGGEYFRLITAGFIHLSLIELLFYGLFLYQLGQLLEKQMGKINYLITFLTSMIVGYISMFILDGNIIAWGMAPGIAGLVVGFFLTLWDQKLYRNRFMVSKATYLFIMVLLMATLGGTSVYGLLGGAICGLFMSVVLSKSKSINPFKIHFIVCGVMLVGVLGYLTLQVNSAFPQYKEVDTNIVKGYKKIGLESYAKRIENTFKKVYEE